MINAYELFLYRCTKIVTFFDLIFTYVGMLVALSILIIGFILTILVNLAKSIVISLLGKISILR